MNKHIRKHGRMSGISMVESLVALVIISVGMLGIAGLYLSSLQAGRSANLRMQAVNLASDMADHIRANKRGRNFYEATATDKGESKDCATATCSAEDIAKNDIYVWKRAISEALPANANGQLDYTDRGVDDEGTPLPDITEVLVTWREPGADVDSTYKTMVEL
jgi:type IV pilus assembly protein PilV